MIDELNIWSLIRNKNTTPIDNLLFLKEVYNLGIKDTGEETKCKINNPHAKSNPTVTYVLTM